MNPLFNHIEALIFCSPKPIATKEMIPCLEEILETKITLKDISMAIQTLQKKYQAEAFSFEIIQSGGGFQFLTKPAYQNSIMLLLKQQSKKRLSNSALETLAIIAYKQPMTKQEIEQIRGVNCDYTIQKLLEKELIELKGKSKSIGRPILYGTSLLFMDYFGIDDIKDLPTPKDFAMKDSDSTIGSKQD